MLPALSVTVYVMVDVPTLKICEPTLLMPGPEDASTVAPVIDQLCDATLQLSETTGPGVATILVHNPAVAVRMIFEGHDISGA